MRQTTYCNMRHLSAREVGMNLRTGAVTLFAAIVFLLALIARQPGMIRAGKRLTPASATMHPPAVGSTPVLVELFTSEGCSSCPPAEALLRRLGRTQPVREADAILLEEHVDYWDRLGWKDPFSSEAATARQEEYGEAFGGGQVYTPQMVVDGHAEFVGNSEGEALKAIRAASAAPKPAMHLSWADNGMLAIHIEQLTNSSRGDTSQVVLAIAENMLHSDVKRGENAGRALEHDGVVRQLVAVGKADAGSIGFSSTIAVRAAHEWSRANLRAVVFVQERHSRRILATAAIPFPAA
jgi:hypothetical protein